MFMPNSENRSGSHHYTTCHISCSTTTNITHHHNIIPHTVMPPPLLMMTGMTMAKNSNGMAPNKQCHHQNKGQWWWLTQCNYNGDNTQCHHQDVFLCANTGKLAHTHTPSNHLIMNLGAQPNNKWLNGGGANLPVLAQRKTSWWWHCVLSPL